MEKRKGRLYVRWNVRNEDYIEDGMKGRKIIQKMECQEGRLYMEDYMDDGMKERKITYKME